MKILNRFMLLSLALVMGSSLMSLLMNLQNGFTACTWQFSTLVMAMNYFRLAREVDSWGEE